MMTDYNKSFEPNGLFTSPPPISAPSNLILGDNLVNIDLKTGVVTLAPGASNAKGAKAFWEAVRLYGVKRPCETETR